MRLFSPQHENFHNLIFLIFSLKAMTGAQWSGPSIVQGTVKPKTEMHGMDRRQEATKSMEEKIKQVHDVFK